MKIFIKNNVWYIIEYNKLLQLIIRTDILTFLFAKNIIS